MGMNNIRKRLHIKVSKYCNNNCIFCLDDRPKRRNVTIKEVESLLEQSKGIKEVLFTCGEPTLHPHLPLFIAMAKKAGFSSIGLVTNGRRLCYPSYCDMLLRAGLTEITISIHGSNAKMHEGLTRTKGSFNQTVEGLKNIYERKSKYEIKLITSTVLTKKNVIYISQILEFLSSFDVDTMVLNIVEPSGEAIRNFEKLTPYYTDISKILSDTLSKFPEKHKVTVEGIPLCFCRNFIECTGIREEIHILEETFKALPINRFQVKPETCKECKLYPKCPGIFEYYAQKRGIIELNPDREM